MSITLGSNPQVPNPLVQPDPNQPSGVTSAPLLSNAVLPPINSYLALPFSRAVFETLGLDLPRNPDDVAAILSDISLQLELTVGITRNNREIAIAQHLSAAYGGLGLIIGSMALNRAEWKVLNDDQKTATDNRNAAIAARDSRQQTSNNLQSQINDKNSTIGSLQGTIAAENATITTLNIQIGVAAAAGNAALVATLTAQRNGVISSRDSHQGTLNQTISDRDSLVAQKATADQDVAVYNNQINAYQQQIDSLETQKTAKDTAYLETQLSMLNVFTLSALFLRALDPINIWRDFQFDYGVTLLFDSLADRLRGGGNLFDINFGPLSFLDQIRLAAVVERVALVFGFDVERNRLSSLLNTLGIGQSNQTTILGLVMEAAILNLSFDQLRDADRRGLLISGALGLVAGLADAVTTLAALDLLVAIDLAELGVSDGLRLRLSI